MQEHEPGYRQAVRARYPLFPIQAQRGARPHPLEIPWSIAELAYSVYAARYGRGQSLERLAERAGFCPDEMDMFLPDWRERCAEIATLQLENLRLRHAIAEHHAQKADDRCIEDDDRLYTAAGLPPCDRRVGDKAAMLENCRRFIERRCEGGGWPTYVQLEGHLQRRETALRLITTDSIDYCDHHERPFGADCNDGGDSPCVYMRSARRIAHWGLR